MKNKVLVTALSVNKDTLESHFLNTYFNLTSHELFDELEISTVIFTQGYSYEGVVDPAISLVRDDSVFNKGLAISDVRNYFTDKLFEGYDFDYLYFCDDDFKFNTESLRALYNDVKFMNENSDIGVTSMHYKKGGPGESLDYYYEFLPSRVAMCSGIVVKKEAFAGWGSGVRYFEECVMAAYAYRKGYKVVHSISNTIHRTKSTGLGISQERKYGKNNIPGNGRKVMCEEGLFIPAVGKDSEGNRFNRYDVPLKNSKVLEESHRLNHQTLGTNFD